MAAPFALLFAWVPLVIGAVIAFVYSYVVVDPLARFVNQRNRRLLGSWLVTTLGSALIFVTLLAVATLAAGGAAGDALIAGVLALTYFPSLMYLAWVALRNEATADRA